VGQGFSPANPNPPVTTFVGDDDPEEASQAQASGPAGFKEAFLAEIRRAKLAFYQMTVAQALRIEVQGDRVLFEFSPVHRMMRDQLEQNRVWLEPLAAKIAGRRMQVASAVVDAPPPRPERRADAAGDAPGPAPDLKAAAVADPGMQAVLDLLPVEITDVQRLK
jgi:hypothetical protein